MFALVSYDLRLEVFKKRNKVMFPKQVEAVNHYFFEGGVSVCGIAVLGYFWCGVAVIFISEYGIAVFRVQAVCGKF